MMQLVCFDKIVRKFPTTIKGPSIYSYKEAMNNDIKVFHCLQSIVYFRTTDLSGFRFTWCLAWVYLLPLTCMLAFTLAYLYYCYKFLLRITSVLHLLHCVNVSTRQPPINITRQYQPRPPFSWEEGGVGLPGQGTPCPRWIWSGYPPPLLSPLGRVWLGYPPPLVRSAQHTHPQDRNRQDISLPLGKTWTRCAHPS